MIESAKVIGLAMLPAKRFHPFGLDAFGLGNVLQAAARLGAERCLVGIGGSATNDAGFGMARALGWKFIDREGGSIEQWTKLDHLSHLIKPSHSALRGMKVIVAVDVRNRLLGSRGGSRIYGPQKGLQVEDFPLVERCLGRLATVTKQHFKKNFAGRPGAGAAGGLGFGLFAFLGAQAVPGFGLFARYARLAERLRAADLVITGEGAIDRSTLMGKCVGEIARRCRAKQIPCIGLTGVMRDQPLLHRRFTAVHCLTPELTTTRRALAEPAFWLERLAARVARRWPAG